MVRENEWTTIRVEWSVKDELLKHIIGRETDNDILKRLLKMHNKNIILKEKAKETILDEQINKRPKKARRR